MISEKQKVRVDDLSEMLDVSPVTIRRDLDFLDSKKLLVRTHGGATKLEEASIPIAERKFLDSGVLNTQEKIQIAKRAAELLHEDDIIYVNSGTTTLSFIAEITKKVRVITNNARAVANKVNTEIELMILGGEYRQQSQSLAGLLTLENIRNINSTYTFLGVNGLCADRGLMTSVIQECSVNSAMISNTNEKVIVLADHSKIGRISNFVTAPSSAIHIIITDDKAPEDKLQEFRALGIEIIIA